MATHIFNIDGTLVEYNTNKWLEGALEHIQKLSNENNNIVLITSRGWKDVGTKIGVAETKETILKDLDDLNIKYTILFEASLPRVLHDSPENFFDKRELNEKWTFSNKK